MANPVKTTDAAQAEPDVDAKIVSLLRENARMPLVALAKRIGLSRSATQERLRRLETRGAIAGYTIRLREQGPAKLRAWLFVRAKEGIDCPSLAARLLETSQIRYCSSVAGTIDLLILVESTNTAELADVRDRIARTPGVADVSTHPILKTFFDDLPGGPAEFGSSKLQHPD